MNAHNFTARVAKENKVRELLSKDMTTRQIAAELGVSQQSVQRYLVRRGWETATIVTETDLHQQLTGMPGDMSIADKARAVGRTEAFVTRLLAEY
jgi:predicted transcriptional regulator